MKLDTEIPVADFIEKLEMDEETTHRVKQLIRTFWEPSEVLEMSVEVDDDEAYDALDKLDKLPEPATLDELLDGDALVEAVKPLLDGDIPTAIILFGRLLGTDTDPQRRLEQMLYARRDRDRAVPAPARLVA